MSPDLLPLRSVDAEKPTVDPPPEPPDHARLIDRDELAHRLSIGVSTLDKLRAAGHVGPRAIRFGGSVRFLLAEVAAWLSTPTPIGELHTARTWPAVWAALQKTCGRPGR